MTLPLLRGVPRFLLWSRPVHLSGRGLSSWSWSVGRGWVRVVSTVCTPLPCREHRRWVAGPPLHFVLGWSRSVSFSVVASILLSPPGLKTVSLSGPVPVQAPPFSHLRHPPIILFSPYPQLSRPPGPTFRPGLLLLPSEK